MLFSRGARHWVAAARASGARLAAPAPAAAGSGAPRGAAARLWTAGCRGRRLGLAGFGAGAVAATWATVRCDGRGSERPRLTREEQSTIGLFNKCCPSVAFVTNFQGRQGRFHMRGDEQHQSGRGSGFVWDDRGYIVTNFHVVQG